MNVSTLRFRLGDSQQKSPSHPKVRRPPGINASSMFASSSQNNTHSDCIADTSANSSKNCTANEVVPTKKGRWTKEEDQRLASIIKEADTDTENFAIIAQRLGTGRSAKQCRDRWNNFLRGGIKKGGWSTDEERVINDLYMTFGPKWAAMAKVLSNRTDSDIKNKWNSMQRKKKRLEDLQNQKVIRRRHRSIAQTTPSRNGLAQVAGFQQQDCSAGNKRVNF